MNMDKENKNDTAGFEKTTWVTRMLEILKDPQRLAEFEQAVAKFLAAKSKSSPTMKRADQAYRIFREGKAKDLLTPRNVILLGAALLYMVTPLDAIPDLVPVVGLLDDLGVLSLILAAILPTFLKEHEKELSPEQQEELHREVRAIRDDLDAPPCSEAEVIIEAEPASTPPQQETECAEDSSFSAFIRRLAARFLPGSHH